MKKTELIKHFESIHKRLAEWAQRMDQETDELTDIEDSLEKILVAARNQKDDDEDDKDDNVLRWPDGKPVDSQIKWTRIDKHTVAHGDGFAGPYKMQTYSAKCTHFPIVVDALGQGFDRVAAAWMANDLPDLNDVIDGTFRILGPTLISFARDRDNGLSLKEASLI